MARKAGAAKRKLRRRPKLSPARGALTQAIPTAREHVHLFFGRLCNQAARLFPEHPADAGGMPGLTDDEIEMLRGRLAALPVQLQTVDALDSLLAHEPDAAGLLYPTLHSLVLLAHFVGAHTGRSEVQRLIHQRNQRDYTGARSALVRKQSPPATPPRWHAHADAQARQLRSSHPTWSNSRLADKLLLHWPAELVEPARDTLRNHLNGLVATAKLPPPKWKK